MDYVREFWLGHDKEAARKHLLGMIGLMGYIVVPSAIYAEAVALLPEVAGQIIEAKKLGDA